MKVPGGRNCARWINEPDSPLNSSMALGMNVPCLLGASVSPHANMRLQEGPCGLSLLDLKPWKRETLPFPTVLLSTGAGPLINIWWVEHWHIFLCNLFLFCILMGSLNQNTFRNQKNKWQITQTPEQTIGTYSYYDLKSPTAKLILWK